MATHPAYEHRWYTPADCAAMLAGVKHGETYRAHCPACDSSRDDALSIRQGTDKYGHPYTQVHCFAHNCDVRDICEALGIDLRNLFSIHPVYAKATRHARRAHSPRIDRLKHMDDPLPDDIIQILLEEDIVQAPEWIQTCVPARKKMWELAQASPRAKEALTKALYDAHLSPPSFWQTLAAEMER